MCHVLHFLVLIWYISGTKDFDNDFFQYTRVFYPMVLNVEVEKLLKNHRFVTKSYTYIFTRAMYRLALKTRLIPLMENSVLTFWVESCGLEENDTISKC